MPRVLIVGYGNPLRSDDGAGLCAAGELAHLLSSPNVEILRRHQLTPEVAESVSRSDAVIFIDAAESGEPGQVRCQPVEIASKSAGKSHQFSPGVVLALARQLYGAVPLAFCVTVTAESFAYRETLSAPVARALPRVVALVESMVEQLLSGDLAISASARS